MDYSPIYVGEVINPKTKEKLQVFAENPDIWNDGRVKILLGTEDKLVGQGHFEYNDLASIFEENYSCARVHVDREVIEIGQGYGFSLYAGMCLALASFYFMNKFTDIRSPDFDLSLGPCIYSPDRLDRSTEADTWWDRQAMFGLARRYPHCIINSFPDDGGEMTIQNIREYERRPNYYSPDSICPIHGEDLDPDTYCHEDECRHRVYLNRKLADIVLLPNRKYKTCAEDMVQILHITDLIEQGHISEAPLLSPELQSLIP